METECDFRTHQSLFHVDHTELSISRQCELLGITRSSVYYQKAKRRKADLILEEKIMQVYLNLPFYGYRRIAKELVRQGYVASPKRVYRLMQGLGIKAIYPKRNLSLPNKQHKKYPYLLLGLEIDHVNQVWASDITYIRLTRGVVYLVAIIDVFSRKVLSHKLSNTPDRSFCLEALNKRFVNMEDLRYLILTRVVNLPVLNSCRFY